MLSAEHYALENKAVQSMLAIRERELNYIDTRMAAIGTQAALIAGFVIGNFVSNFVGPDSGVEITKTNFRIFFYSTGFGLAFAFHCVLNTTFICIWGPGLALRGGTGSVSRAYTEMKAERWQIVASFNLAILCFGIQCITVLEAYDGVKGWSTESAITASILVIGAIVTTLFILRMRLRMSRKMAQRDRVDGNKSEKRSCNDFVRVFCMIFPCCKSMQTQNEHHPMVLGAVAEFIHQHNVTKGLSQPLIQRVNEHEDWDENLVMSDFKELQDESKEETGQTNGAFRTMSMMKGFLFLKEGRVRTKWTRSFFALQGGTFLIFDDEAEYTAAVGKAMTGAERSMSLNEYEVVLNPNDPHFNFSLQPVTNFGSARSRHFRADTVEERDRWMEALVAACILASS